MPELLDFPNEVLLRIIDFVHAEDIESFCVNKHLYWLAEHVLEQHREKKKKYSVLKLSCSTYPRISAHHPVLLLRDLVSDPTIASYPTSLTIQDGGYEDDVDREENRYDASGPKADELLKALEQLKISDELDPDAWSTVREFELLIDAELFRCPYIAIDDLEDLKQGILYWDTDAALALLLSLLPNLQSITFGKCSGIRYRLESVIYNIAKATRVSPGGLHALGKLSKLGIEDDNSDASDLWNISSSITDISIQDSIIYSKFLETLLSRIRSLESFRYRDVGFGKGDHLELSETVKILLQHAGQSLVSLDLIGERAQISGNDTRASVEFLYSHHKARNGGEGGSNFIGSLRGFQKLKTIRLDNSMLIEAVPGSSKEGTKVSVHRLASILPRSVEKLTLSSPFEAGHAEEMLYRLPQNKKTLAPKLKQIVFEHSIPIDGDMQKACAEADIELLLIETGAT